MLRRTFIDLPHGQLHGWRGDLRSAVPLVMLHGSPGSSHSLLPYARVLAEWRDVLLLDTPGNGDSDPAPMAAPGIDDLAILIRAALEATGVEAWSVYGYHTGASLAIALAHHYPDRVRKLVLEGVSFFTEEERAHLMQHEHAPQFTLCADGSHLTKVWDMVKSAHVFWPWWDGTASALRGRGLPDARSLHHEVLQVLKAAETYHLSYRAALAFDKQRYLSGLRLPVLATCSRKDQLWNSLQKVSQYCPHAQVQEVPGFDTPSQARSTGEIFHMFLGEISVSRADA